jgi:peptidase YpeB-like protein
MVCKKAAEKHRRKRRVTALSFCAVVKGISAMMRLAPVLGILLLSSCSANQPSHEDIASYIEIPMAKALKTATRRVPGKAVEAKLLEESNRFFYKIDIVHKQQMNSVYVDAENGLVLKVDTQALDGQLK